MNEFQHSESLKALKHRPFRWSPSTQSALFAYLTSDQRAFIQPILRVLKKPAQENLCSALMDYLEKGDTMAPSDKTLAGIFNYCIQQLTPFRESEPMNDCDESCQSLGTILKVSSIN